VEVTVLEDRPIPAGRGWVGVVGKGRWGVPGTIPITLTSSARRCKSMI
jgi:hypothetical protein